MYNWGKGYAFNPVGYVNPFKDPENPASVEWNFKGEDLYDKSITLRALSAVDR